MWTPLHYNSTAYKDVAVTLLNRELHHVELICIKLHYVALSLPMKEEIAILSFKPTRRCGSNEVHKLVKLFSWQQGAFALLVKQLEG